MDLCVINVIFLLRGTRNRDILSLAIILLSKAADPLRIIIGNSGQVIYHFKSFVIFLITKPQYLGFNLTFFWIIYLLCQ